VTTLKFEGFPFEMRARLLDFLRCPQCKKNFHLVKFETIEDETENGVLYCEGKHFFPVTGGIPRMLPSSFQDHWPTIEAKAPKPLSEPIKSFVEQSRFTGNNHRYDIRTKVNFSNEWDNHDIGGRTWTMELSDRVEWYFLESIHIPPDDLKGKLMLDAGCGNGSQSVAYTEFGLEVIALDLSTGLEKGQAFRNVHAGANPDKVHFVQADLQNPPLAPDSFDIIHSAGVLHHTPNTRTTFEALLPLLKKSGTFYVWLYKYESLVTPIVNSMRAITTRIPSSIFAKLADLTSVPFIGFCWIVNILGIRRYTVLNRKEATLAVHDIFGAPYAHYHNFAEVVHWYKSNGFAEIWDCNDDRRGFGVCGRLPADS
jgi:uncharacterized protein YbaR (Trm112 family)/SAM-dependent methyltransferase